MVGGAVRRKVEEYLSPFGQLQRQNRQRDKSAVIFPRNTGPDAASVFCETRLTATANSKETGTAKIMINTPERRTDTERRNTEHRLTQPCCGLETFSKRNRLHDQTDHQPTHKPACSRPRHALPVQPQRDGQKAPGAQTEEQSEVTDDIVAPSLKKVGVNTPSACR